jgi:hypothetical protein
MKGINLDKNILKAIQLYDPPRIRFQDINLVNNEKGSEIVFKINKG